MGTGAVATSWSWPDRRVCSKMRRPRYGVREYLEKYRQGMNRVSGSPEAFSRRYSVGVHVTLTRVRGH